MKSPSLWLKEHFRLVWWLIALCSAIPALQLVFGYFTGDLGFNPLETLLKTTGHWTLIFLSITLTVTPLRRGITRLSQVIHARYGKRLSDWNWIIRLRRMLGLYSFFYALLHGYVYLTFDLAFEWQWARQDMVEKPYIILGLLAFTLLVTLAATSTDGMIRRLGRNWRRLHRLVYLIAILGVLHFWWQVKVGVYTPIPYTIAIGVLLGYRLLAHFGLYIRRPRDDGMEVVERKFMQQQNSNTAEISIKAQTERC